MRTLAIFKNTKDGSKLTVTAEGNVIMYAFEYSEIYTQYVVVETPFNELTIARLLSAVDDSKVKFDFCIGNKEIFTKFRDKNSEICYSVGNQYYTSMKLLP